MLKHSGTQTINTERLTLRQFQYTDDNDMLAYLAILKFNRYTQSLFIRQKKR